METYKIMDLHQDLLLHLRYKQEIGQSDQTDYEALMRNDVRCVVATAFPFPKDENWFDPKVNQMIEDDFLGYIKKTQEDSRWRIIKTDQDLQEVFLNEDQYGILMHIEGMNVFSENDWPLMERWYELGLRSVGIVWNVSNSLGGGTKEEGGLTALGKEFIKWMSERNMIVDFAHMNSETFKDVAELYEGPILISHGNACALCQNPRNYTDEQLKLVKETNGVVGVFFANTFVVGKENNGTIQDVANHIDYLVEKMGIDHVAIGTDFGGIVTGLIQDLEHIDKIKNLWSELKVRGYTPEQIEKIAYKNATRAYGGVLSK